MWDSTLLWIFLATIFLAAMLAGLHQLNKWLDRLHEKRMASCNAFMNKHKEDE